MKTISMSIIIGAIATCATLSQSNAATSILLFEAEINIDSTVTDLLSPPPPSSINLAGFNTTTGLGTIRVKISHPGSHFVRLFVDHEIDEADNTYFNEFGAAVGTAAGEQSWEIDEPGFVFGNIYDNFELSELDNNNGVPSSAPDDVSMALGWKFDLTTDQEGIATFMVSESAPNSGFFLSQTDPDSQATIYFSSTLDIRPTSNNVPDGGWTLAMLGASITLMGAARRLKQSKRQQNTR